jgi:predicted dehydrogenase
VEKVKAALLGIKHPHSLAHLATLQQLPEVESILLWDEDRPALVSAQAQADKVEAVYTDLATLLAQADLFFVIAALQTDRGPAIFKQVLSAGKHLLAEKPIGRHQQETQEVIEVAEHAGLKLGVCYQNRQQPLVEDARRLVQQGLLGPLISVEVRMITTQVRFRNPQHWLFRQALAGGGMLSWLGCHYIDLIRYITGDEIVSVMAETAIRSGENIDVEDVAILTMRLDSGAIGSLHVGYMLTMSGTGYRNPTGYDLYLGFNGRAGRLSVTATPLVELNLETTDPAWAGAPKRKFIYDLAPSPAYGNVAGEIFVRNFIRAAQGQGDLPAACDDALQVARVVDAAYESSATGRRISIEPPKSAAKGSEL